MSGQFARDFGGADFDLFSPSEMVGRRDDQTGRVESAFDLSGRINRQRTFGDQLSEKTSFDNGVANDGFGVENIAFGFYDEGAFGLKVFGYRVGDAIILEIHVAATALAHGGFGVDHHFQLGAA